MGQRAIRSWTSRHSYHSAEQIVKNKKLEHRVETCWAVVKNQIARKNKFTMAHLLEQLDDAFGSVTEETCTGLIKKVREVEDKYWREDARLDREQ